MKKLKPVVGAITAMWVSIVFNGQPASAAEGMNSGGGMGAPPQAAPSVPMGQQPMVPRGRVVVPQYVQPRTSGDVRLRGVTIIPRRQSSYRATSGDVRLRGVIIIPRRQSSYRATSEEYDRAIKQARRADKDRTMTKREHLAFIRNARKQYEHEIAAARIRHAAGHPTEKDVTVVKGYSRLKEKQRELERELKQRKGQTPWGRPSNRRLGPQDYPH